MGGAAAGGEAGQFAAADHRAQPPGVGIDQGQVQAAAGRGLQPAGAQGVEFFQEFA
jgi:hypothetical protein